MYRFPSCLQKTCFTFTKTEKGEQVIMHLVADLVEDGVIGDNEREGNEESMQSYSQIVTIDMITHSVRNKGKLADQKTVIDFRKQGKDRLAYWLANRVDHSTRPASKRWMTTAPAGRT